MNFDNRVAGTLSKGMDGKSELLNAKLIRRPADGLYRI